MNEAKDPGALMRAEPDVRSGSVEVPVDLGLLEDRPSTEGDDAYALPNPVMAAELVAEIEQRTAEQVTTVRDEQSLRIANTGQGGVHHFLVNVEGQELCGSCGTPFPCEKWTGEIEPRNLAESAGQPVPDEDKARALAELLGVPVERAREIVLASTSLNEPNSKGV